MLAFLLGACAGKQRMQPGPADPVTTNLQQIMDTGKIKSEVNELINGISTGKPDTAKMKTVGADVLSATASILSDTGISAMYGNSNDPSVKEAGDILKKMRNAMGITPDKLDSMKKAAEHIR